MPCVRTEDALEDLQRGRMIILCDDESRENEGDLIGAAAHVSPEMINFMAVHARGLICVPMSPDRGGGTGGGSGIAAPPWSSTPWLNVASPRGPRPGPVPGRWPG